MLAAAQMGEEHVCAERLKVSREEELYRQDVNHLEKDLLWVIVLYHYESIN